jgi:hypothetical protein
MIDDFTAIERGMIAAAERELGRRLLPAELQAIDRPVTVEGLRKLVKAIAEDVEDDGFTLAK